MPASCWHLATKMVAFPQDIEKIRPSHVWAALMGVIQELKMEHG